MRGRFIVIEGIDGAGKTTQAELLRSTMSKNGIINHLTHEASDGPIGRLLREEYLSGNRKCDERVINKLYAADRLDHITNENDGILKYINDGVNVICDRYVLSSLAYDTYSLIGTDQYDYELHSILEINRTNLQLLEPDITIVIDLPIGSALERITSRNEGTSIYEKIEKMQKISRSYNNAIELLRNQYYEKIVVVDGYAKTMYELQEEIWKIVQPIVKQE